MADVVNIAISKEMLERLIQQQVLCAADFSCLDQQSKQKVWQLCLSSCKKSFGCEALINHTDTGLYAHKASKIKYLDLTNSQ